MNAEEPVVVFIGSGEASKLERKVLQYSLQKHSSRNLDIRVFNGTHNAIERQGREPELTPMPLHIKYRNVTEFSLYRYLIPEMMNHQGRAIWLDSDMVALADIGELFDADLGGNDYLAKSEHEAGQWTTSVMLLDCQRARFDLQLIFDEIDQGLYSYRDFSRYTDKFSAHHPSKIGSIDPHWNSFDYHDHQTKLIHYTRLHTQPWKHRNHPYGQLWFDYFKEAQEAGFITEQDIYEARVRSYVRQDIVYGNKGTDKRLYRFARGAYRLITGR